jgi:hypothetical protein
LIDHVIVANKRHLKRPEGIGHLHRPKRFFFSTIVGPNGTLQYGYDTLKGVGARPLFVKWAQRDPQNRGQFFTGDAINNSSNYFCIPTFT